MSEYKSQSARDAQSLGYGDKDYWDCLEQSAKEKYEYFMRRGDRENAQMMFSRSLSDALAGNNGD